MASATATRLKKAEIIKKIGRATTDTGSPEVQIALITNRIAEMNQHLTKFGKDHSSRRGLLRLVGQRKRLLSYIKKTMPKRYTELLAQLELRK